MSRPTCEIFDSEMFKSKVMLEPHIAVLFVIVTSGFVNLVVMGIVEASSKILFVYRSMCVKDSPITDKRTIE